MRNLRKLTAVVIAIALVLTSMTAVFAAATPVYGDEAATLKALGLYAGTNDNDVTAGLDGALTTQDSLIFLAKLFGYFEAANDLTADEVADGLAKFDDADAIAGYAENVVAYSAINGILSGSTKGGKFFVEPKATVTDVRFATFILKKMGYEVADFTESVAQLAEVKGSEVSDVEIGDLTRDDAVGMMYAVLTAEKADGETVIAAIVGDNAELKAIAEEAGLIKVPVVTELAIDSVTSTNLREVFVKFNAEVDKTTAEDKANYTSDSAVGSAKLQSDKKTVKLTIDGAAQQKVLDLVVKNVKDAAGKAIAETKKSITLFDTTIPETLSYKFTGPQTIEILFSEPISTANSTGLSVLVDNGVYGASAAVKAGDEYTVKIDLGTVLPEGEHKLLIKGAKDFAAYTALDKEFTMTYTKDTAVSVVTLDSAAEKSVTLKFSKPVKFVFSGTTTAADFFYHTYTAYTPDSVTSDGTAPIVSGTYYDKVVLDFTSKPLPSGSTKVVVKAKVGSESVADAYGVALPEDVVLTAAISVDLTAPTITKVEAVAENKVEITYSEDVQNAGEKANYTFKNSEGKDIDAGKIVTVTYASKKATVNFSEKLAGGAYTVEVKNIKDNSVSVNGMVVVPQTFTVTDKTPITEISEVLMTDDGKTLFVTFPENMATTGANSVLEQSNYLFGTNAATAKALTDAAISVFGTSNKVKIVLKTSFAGNTLYVKSVADVAGNVMTAMYLEKTTTSDAAPAITAIKTIAKNKLEITVDKNLQSINASNILVDGIDVAQASYVNKDANAIITVVLKDAGKLANGAAVPGTVGITAGSTIKSITGKAMEARADWTTGTGAVTPTDGIAPVVKEIKFVNATTITVEFDEAILAASVAGAGKNGFAVVGGTLTSATYTSANVITLTGTSFTNNTDVTYTPGNILDASSNALAAFSHTDTLK